MIAEFLTPVTVPDPTVVLIGGAIFVIGAAVVSLVQRFNVEGERAFNARVAAAVQDLHDHNKRLEDQLCVTRQQLMVCETDRARLQARCDLLDCPKSSRKPSDPA